MFHEKKNYNMGSSIMSVVYLKKCMRRINLLRPVTSFLNSPHGVILPLEPLTNIQNKFKRSAITWFKQGYLKYLSVFQ